MLNSYGATTSTPLQEATDLVPLVAQEELRRRPRRRALALTVAAILVCTSVGALAGAASTFLKETSEDEFLLYKQDPEGEVCSAFDQSADYSKCGRLEPAGFYWWARNKYGDSVEESCGRSASMATNNPIPLSEGITFTHWSVGNAWFVVCNYQILSRLDEYCEGNFQAEEPKQEAPPRAYFGFDGLNPTDEDKSKGWTDPCAAHAFCSACDGGSNPYCKAYMQQKLHCNQHTTDYHVHSLFNESAKEYWCSKVPEIKAGTFKPHRMHRDECTSIFFS